MPFGLGELPKEYNAKIHGPYDPAIYYGKKDVAFGQVKLGELPAWLSRRSMSPVAMGRACSRAYWRWLHAYVFPRKGGVAPFVQVAVASSLLFYVMNYPNKIANHKNYKYHW